MRSRPVDEPERRLAVEVEVPEVAQEPDVLPVADAGQEGVEERDALDLRREPRGVGVRDHESDVVPGDCDLRVAERHGERMDVAGHRHLVVAAFGLARRAGAAQIGCDHRAGLRELGDQRAPHPGVLREAVQEDDRRAAPGTQVVDAHAVELREAALDRRLRAQCGRRDRGDEGEKNRPAGGASRIRGAAHGSILPGGAILALPQGGPRCPSPSAIPSSSASPSRASR